MANSWKSALGSIRANLVLLVLSSVLGFAVLLVQGHSALTALEQSAHQMGDGKDVVADILPPPLYLIEPHLLAHQLLEVPVSERAALVEKLALLKQRYTERNAFWLANAAHLDSRINAALLGEQKSRADAYWQYLEQSFVPKALDGRDADGRLALRQLNTLYAQHRLGVDATVELASEWANARLRELDTTKRHSLWGLTAVALLCAGIAMGVFVAVRRHIARSLGAEPAELRQEMVRLAQGDLRPSQRAAEDGSVFSALQEAQRSLMEHVQRTEQTNLQLQQTLTELNHLVGTDALTGLWSRRRLEDTASIEIARHRRYAQPLSILFIDIDHFKAVNDHFGHEAGDRVLQHLAALIQLSLRTSDSVARWGGEEFLVLCTNTELQTAQVLAQRLKDKVADSALEPVGHITLSIGVAEVHADEHWQEWFKRADTALYAAKNQGRNKVCIAD
ncbi:MAG: GGDEF domain-containing protein [Rhodoferax sp.]|nr:GGDEF domain-containing protein [Rhodoferax sp.]